MGIRCECCPDRVLEPHRAALGPGSRERVLAELVSNLRDVGFVARVLGWLHRRADLFEGGFGCAEQTRRLEGLLLCPSEHRQHLETFGDLTSVLDFAEEREAL